MTPRPARLGAVAAVCVATAQAPAQITAHQHLAFAVGDASASVTIRVSGLSGTGLWVRMPAWLPTFRPGIRAATPPPRWQLRATRGTTTLTVAELPRRGWTVATGGAEAITLRYEVPIVGRTIAAGLGQRYPHTFRDPDTDAKPSTIRYHECFVFRAGSTWLEIPGATQRLTLDLPKGFEVATALPRAEDGSYTADTYSTLLGAPLHVGRFRMTAFAVDGVSHRLVLSGFDRDRTDRKELVDRLTKLIRANRAAMGPLPYAEYTFLLGRRDGNPDAVGHPRCAEIVTHQLRASETLARAIAGAHLAAWNGEWFHPVTWDNVPFASLSAEAWFMLGARDYLTDLALVRAGFEEPDAFWTRAVAAKINKLQMDGRRLESTVAETGARIRTPREAIRPGAPHPRLVGWLLCLLLDVEIRSNTGGKRSFDHAVRELAGQCDARKRGYSNADIRASFEKTGGRELADIFACVTTVKELPFTASLAKVGIHAQPGTRPDPKKPVSKRMPQPRRRPPRWRVDLAPKPTDAVLRLRTGITRGV